MSDSHPSIRRFELIDALPEPVWFVDNSHSIAHLNTAAEIQLDCRLSSVNGMSLNGMGLTSESVERLQSCWNTVFSTHEPDTARVVIPSAKGGCEVSATFAPAWDHNGDMIGLVGLLRESAPPAVAPPTNAGLEPHSFLLDGGLWVEYIRTLLASGSQPEILVLVVRLNEFQVIAGTHEVFVTEALRAGVIRRLTGHLRQDDRLAWLEGDELGLVIGTGVGSLSDQHAVERIQQQFASRFTCATHEFSLTCTIGVRRWVGEDVRAEDLIEDAKQALALAQAQADQQGWRAFQQGKTNQEQSEAKLLAELSLAIDRDELFLQYQPQVALLSGKIVGAEALVRWRHPERGIVPPGHFIPLAEGTPLIERIGDWVLRSACRQLREWKDKDLVDFHIGVNMSSRHFRQPDLANRIAGLLEEFSLDPNELELEITESTLMEDINGAIRTLRDLEAMGLRISLDDFGTGYSSLAYLSCLPTHTLKIDRSFVTEVYNNPVNAAIATATIAMAHSLGKSVIAEGVETEAELAWFRRKRCDEIQGYLFSRPLSVEDFESKIQSGDQLSGADASEQHIQPTVLLVDDEPYILNALQRQLYSEGYQLLTAASAAEALELLAMNEVHVVISDQRMPGMTGIEFLSRVKDLYPDTVRMVLSGSTDMETITEAINHGAISKYFIKPCDFEQLRTALKLAFRSLKLGDQQTEDVASAQA